MLTSEQGIVVYSGGRAVPDRLGRKTHAHYVEYARRMLAVYEDGAGRMRRELHRSVEGILADEPDCETRRIQAFCKLLDDAAVYDTDPEGAAAKLRMRVFAMAAPSHPLVREADRLFESAESEVKARIARELDMAWDEVDAGLYADVIDFQRLKSFSGYPAPEALLSRYNVAQVQVCLYRAERMTVTATQDFKTILKYAKLARLLHEIERVGPSNYRINLAGPASVLAETRRYGVNMARFLPALLACQGWTMRAPMTTPWRTRAALVLSDKDGLRSHLPPPEEFDSIVEEAFARKFGEEREGWRLLRESEIIHEGQRVFVPDFTFRHRDGVEALLEIVGFWTPEYLAAKRQTIARFRKHRILLAVPKRQIREEAQLGPEVIVYATRLKIEPVLEALSQTSH
jgi:uncharacterized protein